MIRRSILHFVETNYRHKFMIAVLAEVFLFTGILYLSYLIRLGGIDEKYLPQIIFLISFYIPIKLCVFFA